MRIGKRARVGLFVAVAAFAAGFWVVALRPWQKTPPLPEIPYHAYSLDNGLRVVIHQDDSAPVVAISLWYHVGSRNEKSGQNGLAHLAEHLMFEGSLHLDEDLLRAIERLGATDYNGTTDRDRTRFFMTVPRQALDAALWLESDRMGYLRQALSEEKLQRARAIVKKEIQRSQADPYFFVDRALAELSLPDGHPYLHPPLGSLQDLKTVTLADVEQWFRDFYNPCNAVLVLVGDIDAETALEKATAYFGGLSPGQPPPRDRTSLASPYRLRRREVQADVPEARLYKVWNVPGYASAELDSLDLLRHALAFRLEERLVRDLGIASHVSVELRSFEICGQFQFQATVSPGSALEALEAEADKEIQAMLEEGPRGSEIDSIKAALLSSLSEDMKHVGGVGGKSGILAISQLFANDPGHYRASLARLRQADSEDVQEAARRWLSSGASVLHVTPRLKLRAAGPDADRSRIPEVQPALQARLPRLDRHRLENGLLLLRASMPEASEAIIEAILKAPGGMSRIAMESQLLNRLKASPQFDQALRGLAMDWSLRCNSGGCAVRLQGSADNLAPSLAKLAAWVKSLGFLESAPTLGDAGLRNVKPHDLAPLLLDIVLSGQNEEGSPIEHFTPAESALVLVGNMPFPELQAMVKKTFADWAPSPSPHPARRAGTSPLESGVLAVDRPASQAFVCGGLRLVGSANWPTLRVLSAVADARINHKLRSEKQWSYQAGVALNWHRQRVRLDVCADVPVQRLESAMAEIEGQVASLAGNGTATRQEIEQARDADLHWISAACNSPQELADLVYQVVSAGFGPDEYATIIQEIQQVEVRDVTAAAKALKTAGNRFKWLLVGDRKSLESASASFASKIQWLEAGAVMKLARDRRMP